MSQKNVEVVHHVFEHWERGDWGWGREFFDDSCEVVLSTSWFPDAGTYRVGREALRAWLGFTDSFETFATRVDQIIDAGERVVVLTRIGLGAEPAARMSMRRSGPSSRSGTRRSLGMC